MNILVLINLDRSFGGGGYSVYKYFEYFAKRGHRVHLLYVTNPSFKIKQSNFITYTKPMIPLKLKGVNYINKFLERLTDTVMIPHLIKKNRFDYIVGYQRRTAIKATKLSEKYNLKVANIIFETPDWLMSEWNDWEKIWRKNKRLRNSWKKFANSLGKSDIIIANSKLTQKYVEKWINKKISGFVYPGVDVLNGSDRKKPSRENQIVFIGRLQKNKNVNIIIEALALLKIDCKLIICGDGPERQKLEALANELNVRVSFLGRVTERRKWEELQKSFLMVYPSSFEGFGIPPMEALACEIPCICSDIPIFKEIYNDKVDFFKEHDIDELAEKIKFLLENPQYCKMRGDKGKEYVEINFGWDKSAHKIEVILNKNVISK